MRVSHGFPAISAVFDDPPSTLGKFLRMFTFGHVRQLGAVASRFLINLAKNAPILPGADQAC
jgi:hypothetical protein